MVLTSISDSIDGLQCSLACSSRDVLSLTAMTPSSTLFSPSPWYRSTWIALLFTYLPVSCTSWFELASGMFKHNYIYKIETNKVKKKRGYLMRQDNAIDTFSIKLSFSSIGQEKSKLQKQISKLLILIAIASS